MPDTKKEQNKEGERGAARVKRAVVVGGALCRGRKGVGVEGGRVQRAEWLLGGCVHVCGAM
jgi:hypothetical protein